MEEEILKVRVNEHQHYLGVVIRNDDPMFIGRCKIRVFGMFDAVPDSDLPWAHQRYEMSFGDFGGSGRISIPKIGSVVHGQLNNKNFLAPEYKAIQVLSSDLIDEIKGSYEGAHSLIYDGVEQLKVIYTRDKGITINLKDSFINIANDNSITVQHRDSVSSITLVGPVITLTSNDLIKINTAGNIQVIADQNIDIISGANTISLDDSGINIDGGGNPVYINGKNQVLYALNPGATDILDVSEIGVSNSVKIGA